jgi:LPS O-antigen subunit length determinant protein (WzzB/FepE family)
MDTTETEIAPQPQNWKAKFLIAGALLGALMGLTAAYLLVQRAETEAAVPRITAGEGVKLGLLAFGTLRQVAQLGEK